MSKKENQQARLPQVAGEKRKSTGDIDKGTLKSPRETEAPIPKAPIMLELDNKEVILYVET